ncbi:hypothetical protein [Oceanithermus sp.]
MFGPGPRLAALIERLSRRARPRPRPPVSRWRRYEEVRLELDLEARYYLASGGNGKILIPHDEYLEEVERILLFCTNGPAEGR